MFALIDTKGATHIAIHIPHEGAEKNLPALAAMLEQNAVFIRQGYQELATVEPAMQIVLGDQHRVENYGVELMVLAVPRAGAVITDDFVTATPEVLTSNAKGLKAKDDELSGLRTELSFVKDELARYRAQIEAMTAPTEA